MKLPRVLFYVLGLLASSAQAATVWTLGPSPAGEMVTFSDERGPCVGGAHVAVWQKPGRDPVPACYRIDGGMLLIAFLDGDSVQLPASLLKKATGA